MNRLIRFNNKILLKKIVSNKLSSSYPSSTSFSLNLLRYQSSSSSTLPSSILDSSSSLPSIVSTHDINNMSNLYTTFSKSPIIHQIEDLISYFHDITSLSWVSSILCTAFFLRLFICFPLRTLQEKITVKEINIQPKLKELIQDKLRSVNLKSLNNAAKRKTIALIVRIFFQLTSKNRTK